MNIIRDKYGRNAHEDYLKEAFGLTHKQKWPKEGMEAMSIQGIIVYVAPLSPGRRVHRAMACCPVCGEYVAAGRLFQHGKVHSPTPMYDAAFDVRKL